MKRFLCLLFVLCFLPVLSSAEDDPFVGIWINDTPSGMKSRTIVTYQILSSGTVFYSRQEHFFNGDPAKVETAVYSSETTGESIRIQDGDRVVTELYRVNAYQLSTDSRKTYGFYNRVLESNSEYVAARSFEEQTIKNYETDLSPVGRWTISSNYKTLHDNYMFSMTDIYIFEDGSVYRVSIGKKKKENELSIGYDNGVWIGDQNELTIRVGKDVYKANIDENGFLYILNNDGSSLKFVRVCDPEATI